MVDRRERAEQWRKQCEDLRKALEYTLKPHEETAFQDMLGWLERHPMASLSERQAEWLETVLTSHEPAYENLFSEGKVPRGKEVELLVKDKPLRPPGRR